MSVTPLPPLLLPLPPLSPPESKHYFVSFLSKTKQIFFRECVTSSGTHPYKGNINCPLQLTCLFPFLFSLPDLHTNEKQQHQLAHEHHRGHDTRDRHTAEQDKRYQSNTRMDSRRNLNLVYVRRTWGTQSPHSTAATMDIVPSQQQSAAGTPLGLGSLTPPTKSDAFSTVGSSPNPLLKSNASSAGNPPTSHPLLPKLHKGTPMVNFGSPAISISQLPNFRPRENGEDPLTVNEVVIDESALAKNYHPAISNLSDDIPKQICVDQDGPNLESETGNAGKHPQITDLVPNPYGLQITPRSLAKVQAQNKNASPFSSDAFLPMLKPCPKAKQGKITLALDIDETLVHASMQPRPGLRYDTIVHINDGRYSGDIYDAFRPHSAFPLALFLYPATPVCS
jgi:hypothetical protein